MEASRCFGFILLFYGAEFPDVVAVALGHRFHRPDGELDFFHVLGHRVQLRELLVHAGLAFKDKTDFLFQIDQPHIIGLEGLNIPGHS